MAGPRTGRHAGQVRIQERVGNPGLKSNGGNISAFDQSKTRDIAAAKAGLGSGKTLEAGVSPIWGMLGRVQPLQRQFPQRISSMLAQ